MSRFMKDLAIDRAANPGAAQADRWDPTEEEDDEDDDDVDMNIVDRSTSDFPNYDARLRYALTPTPTSSLCLHDQARTHGRDSTLT